MQKKLLSLLLFSILSTLAYSQKKGKMAIPIIEEKIETSQWESKKTRYYSWLVIYDQKKIDSILAIKVLVSTNEKPKLLEMKK